MDKIPNQLLFILLFIFSGSVYGFDIKYVPAYCEPKDLNLIVSNKTSESQIFWTQIRFETELQEHFHEIDPFTEIKIPGNEFLANKTSFSVKYLERNSLQIRSSCKGTVDIPLSDLTSSQVSHFLPSAVRTLKVHLLNLFLKSNLIKLKAYNKHGTEIDSKEILLEKYYDTLAFKWSFTQEVTRIDIDGAERLHSLLFYVLADEEKLSPAIALKPVVLPLDFSKTYFLVSTKDARPEDAFVIALSDQQKINTAREQIKNPQLEKIIVAGIGLGNGGFNRAFLSRDKSPYSWSVTSVDAFADFAHIDCDGSPDLTEERLMQKLNEGGRICFWRYRIIKELSPQEVALGVEP